MCGQNLEEGLTGQRKKSTNRQMSLTREPGVEFERQCLVAEKVSSMSVWSAVLEDTDSMKHDYTWWLEGC